MPDKYHNPLRFYTLRITESSDQAEVLATRYEEYFKELDRWDQCQALLNIDLNGYEEELAKIH